MLTRTELVLWSEFLKTNDREFVKFYMEETQKQTALYLQKVRSVVVESDDPWELYEATLKESDAVRRAEIKAYKKWKKAKERA